MKRQRTLDADKSEDALPVFLLCFTVSCLTHRFRVSLPFLWNNERPRALRRSPRIVARKKAETYEYVLDFSFTY